MAKIAYFFREMSEYIQIDIDLLRERHEVAVIECASRWPRPAMLWKLVQGNDLIVTWFASWHSFPPAVLCRLLGRPLLATVGGYDTANLPDIGYGHQRGGARRWVAQSVMQQADLLVALSEFTRSELLVLGIAPSRVAVVPLGLDPGRYAARGQASEPLVVTVCGVNESNMKRKGLEAFVRAASLLRECRFVVVGAWSDGAIDRLRAMATPNVVFTGRLPHDQKVAWLARARVFVQASRHEAFGLAVLEGMLCGCVPVVTRTGALPEVVGDCGVMVSSMEPPELAAGIEQALATYPYEGERARCHALQRYGLDRRRAGLEALVDDLLLRVPS